MKFLQHAICFILLTASCFHLQLNAEDSVIHEQWFNGYLDRQPAINAYEQIIGHDDGSRTTSFETTIAISRSLFGIDSTLKIVQRRKFVENAKGFIHSFVFEDDENGKRISAVARIEGKTISATITSPLSNRQQVVIIPDDIELMGTLRSQEYLNEHAQKIGDTVEFTGVEMIAGKIILIQMKATYAQLHKNGNKTFKIVTDLLPLFTTTMVIDPNGYTREISIPMGFMTISMRSAKGPMQLEAAKLDITKMIKTDGRMPVAGTNIYRISAASLQHIQEDPYQIHNISNIDSTDSKKTGTITISNNPQSSVLSIEETQMFLAKELQLEIDDPALRAWVAACVAEHSDEDIATRSEILRQRVRTHITTKDLSQADASALETFHSRVGDCTEHANLLCAALRIDGIPARTEVGFVFAPSIKSWVGHAWVSAYDADNKTWIHLDAAYPGIQRSNYIKTASTSGGDSTGKTLTRGMGALLGQKIIIESAKNSE